MSNQLEFAKIGKPVKKTTMNLRCFHESTTGFMMPNVPFIFLMDGKDEVKMNFDDFNKLNPLPKPTMGEATFKLAWYFVPRRLIFGHVQEFMTHTIVHGLPDDNLYFDNCPIFNYVEFMDYFTRQDLPRLLCVSVKVGGTEVTLTEVNYDTYFGNTPSDPADFSYMGKIFKFTSLGIQVKTIFEQLGYAIGHDLDTGKIWNLNAEPILAFCKVMLDHYIPRMWDGYTNTFQNLYHIIENIENYVNANIGTNWFDEFIDLCLLVCYNDDYLTQCFNNIGGPNTESDPSIINGTSYASTIQGYNQANAILATISERVSSGNLELTQQDLNTLRALDKEMKKNQIIGAKSWDRFLARFGITPEKALIKVSYKICDEKYPIIFGDVMSSSDTMNGNVGENLGAYAGKGQASLPKDGFFDFEASEPGYLIAIKTIVPEVAYCNRFDNLVLRTHRYDFWNEEYDGIGCEPVSALEVFSGYDMNPAQMTPNTQNSIFGFMPRYAGLKTMVNKSSGKFSMPSIRNEMDGWTFTRWFNWQENLGKAQISPSFLIGAHSGYRTNNISTQFDRIFYVPTEHNFNCYTAFKFELRTLKKPLFYYDDIIDENEKSFKIEIGNKVD